MNKVAIPTADEVVEKYVDPDVLAAIRTPQQPSVPTADLRDPREQWELAGQAVQHAEGRASGLYDAGRLAGGAALQGLGGAFDALAFVTGDTEGNWVSDAFQSIADGFNAAGERTTMRVAPDRLQSVWEFEGDIWQPSTWQMPDPSEMNVASAGYTFAQLFGSFLPMIVASFGTSGAAAALGASRATAQAAGYFAASGTSAGVLAGSAMNTAQDVIRMGFEDGHVQETPLWQELMERGFSEEEALNEMQAAASNYAVLGGAALGAFGGIATNAILRGHFVNAALGARSRATRVAASVAAGSVEEGAQEVAENVWARFSAKEGGGADYVDVWETSFGDFIAGAIAGGGIGAIGGATSRAAPEEGDGPPADEAPTGEAAEAGDTGVTVPEGEAADVAAAAAAADAEAIPTGESVAPGGPLAVPTDPDAAVAGLSETLTGAPVAQAAQERRDARTAIPLPDDPEAAVAGMQQTVEADRQARIAPAEPEAAVAETAPTPKPGRFLPGALKSLDAANIAKKGKPSRDAIAPYLPQKPRGQKYDTVDVRNAIEAYQAAQAGPATAQADPAAPQDAPAEASPATALPTEASADATPPASNVTPSAQAAADRLGIDAEQVAGTGAGGRVTVRDINNTARDAELASQRAEIADAMFADTSPAEGPRIAEPAPTKDRRRAAPVEGTLTAALPTQDVAEPAAQSARREAIPGVDPVTVTQVARLDDPTSALGTSAQVADGVVTGEAGTTIPAAARRVTPRKRTARTPEDRAVAVFHDITADSGIIASDAVVRQYLQQTGRTEQLASLYDPNASSDQIVMRVREGDRRVAQRSRTRQEAIRKARDVVQRYREVLEGAQLAVASVNDMIPRNATPEARRFELERDPMYAETDGVPGALERYTDLWDTFVDSVRMGDQSRVDRAFEQILSALDGSVSRFVWDFAKVVPARDTPTARGLLNNFREVHVLAMRDATDHAMARLAGLAQPVATPDTVGNIIGEFDTMLGEARSPEQVAQDFDRWMTVQYAKSLRASLPQPPKGSDGVPLATLLLTPSMRVSARRGRGRALDEGGPAPEVQQAMLGGFQQRQTQRAYESLVQKGMSYLQDAARRLGTTVAFMSRLEQRRIPKREMTPEEVYNLRTLKGDALRKYREKLSRDLGIEKLTPSQQKKLNQFNSAVRTASARALLNTSAGRTVAANAKYWQQQWRERADSQKQVVPGDSAVYVHVPGEVSAYVVNTPEPLPTLPVTGVRQHDVVPPGQRVAARQYMVELNSRFKMKWHVKPDGTRSFEVYDTETQTAPEGATSLVEAISVDAEGKIKAFRVADSGSVEVFDGFQKILEAEGAEIVSMVRSGDTAKARAAETRQAVLLGLAREYAARVSWRWGEGERTYQGEPRPAAQQARTLEGEPVGMVTNRRGNKEPGFRAAAALRDYEIAIAQKLGITPPQPIPKTSSGVKPVRLRSLLSNRRAIAPGGVRAATRKGAQYSAFRMENLVPRYIGGEGTAPTVARPVKMKTRPVDPAEIAARDIVSYDMRDVEMVDPTSFGLSAGQYIEVLQRMAPVIADTLGTDMTADQMSSVVRESLRLALSDRSIPALPLEGPTFEPGKPTNAKKAKADTKPPSQPDPAPGTSPTDGPAGDPPADPPADDTPVDTAVQPEDEQSIDEGVEQAPDPDAVDDVLSDIDLENVDLGALIAVLNTPRSTDSGTAQFMSRMAERAQALTQALDGMRRAQETLGERAGQALLEAMGRTNRDVLSHPHALKIATRNEDGDFRIFRNPLLTEFMGGVGIVEAGSGWQVQVGIFTDFPATIRTWDQRPPEGELISALTEAFVGRPDLIERIARDMMRGEFEAASGRKSKRKKKPGAPVTQSNEPTSTADAGVSKDRLQTASEPIYGHVEPGPVPARPKTIPEKGWERMTPHQQRFAGAFIDVFTKRRKIVDAGGRSLLHYRDVFLTDGAGTGKTMSYMAAVKQALDAEPNAPVVIVTKNVGGTSFENNSFMRVPMRPTEVEALGLNDKKYGLQKVGEGRDAYYEPITGQEDPRKNSRIRVITHQPGDVSALINGLADESPSLLVLDESHAFTGSGTGTAELIDAVSPTAVLHVSATPATSKGKGLDAFAMPHTDPELVSRNDTVRQVAEQLGDDSSLVTEYAPSILKDQGMRGATMPSAAKALAGLGLFHSRHMPRRQEITTRPNALAPELVSAFDAERQPHQSTTRAAVEMALAADAVAEALKTASPQNKHVVLLQASYAGNEKKGLAERAARALLPYLRGRGLSARDAKPLIDLAVYRADSLGHGTPRTVSIIRDVLQDLDLSRVGFLGSTAPDGTTLTASEIQKRFMAGQYDVIVGTGEQLGTGIDLDAQQSNQTVTLHLAGQPKSGAMLTQNLGRHDRASTKGRARTVFHYPVKTTSKGGQTTSNAHKGMVANTREALYGRNGINRSLGIDPAQVYTRSAPPLKEGFLRAVERARFSQTLKESPTDVGLATVLQSGSVQDGLNHIAEFGTPFERALARILKRFVTPGVTVGMVDGTQPDSAMLMSPDDGHMTLGVFMPTHESGPRVLLAADAPALTQTFLHEAVHAATLTAMQNSRDLRDRVAQLMGRVSQGTREGFAEAFQNPYEFIANATTDSDLQAALKSEKGLDGRSFWRRMWDEIKSFLGFGPQVTNRAFADLMDAVWLEASADLHPATRDMVDYLPERLFRRVPEGATVGPENAMSRMMSVAPDGLASRGRSAWEKLMRGTLKVTNFTHVVEMGTPLFQKYNYGNVLGDVMDSVRQENQERQRYMEQFQRGIGKKWSKFVEKAAGRRVTGPFGMNYKTETVNEVVALGHLMVEANIANVDFSRPASHANNEALRNRHKPSRMRAQAIWDKYKPIYDKTVSVESRRMYQELDAHYRKEYDQILASIVGTKLDLLAPELRRPGEATFTARSLKELEELIGSDAVASAEDGSSSVRDQLAPLRDILGTRKRKGTYMPLNRSGDYVVKVDESITVENYAQAQEALSEYPGATFKPIDGKNLSLGGTVDYTSVNFFETRVEADTFHADAVKEFGDSVVQPVQRRADGLYPKSATVNNALIRRFRDSIENKPFPEGMDENERRAEQALREKTTREFALAVLDLAPGSSIANSFRSRRGVPGANIDIQRTLIDRSNQTGRYLASLKHRDNIHAKLTRLTNAARQIERAGDPGDGVKARAFAEYAANNIHSHDEQFNVSSLARFGSDLGFFYHLVSVSYNLVNATQPMLYSMPHMAGRHGLAATNAAMMRAYKNVGGAPAKKLLRSGMSVRELGKMWSKKRFEARDYDVTDELVGSTADPNIRRLLRGLVDSGDINVSLAADLQRAGARRSIGPDGKYTTQSAWEFTTEWMRMAPHLTEVMNRSVTAAAAFELEFARAKREKKSDAAAYEQAKNYARETLDKTQYAYAPWNRAPVLRNQWARIALMFMQHSQNTTFNLLRYIALSANLADSTPEQRSEARKAMMYFTGAHILAVGAIGGIPEIIKPFVALGGMLFGAGDEEDWRLGIRNQMADMFGPEVGRIVSHGGLSLLGIDATTRLGVDSLLWRSQGFGDTNAAVRSVVETFGGPLAGLGIRTMDAATFHLPRGDFLKATEAVTPKAVRDIMAIYRTNMYGETDRGQRQFIAPDEMSAWEYLMMGVGFNPMTRADASIARSAQFRYRRVENQRREILDRAFADVTQGRGLRATRERVRDFQRRHPDLRLSMRSVQQSIKRRRDAERSQRNYTFRDTASQRFIDNRTRFLDGM